jgi:hypothetical protein
MQFGRERRSPAGRSVKISVHMRHLFAMAWCSQQLNQLQFVYVLAETRVMPRNSGATVPSSEPHGGRFTRPPRPTSQPGHISTFFRRPTNSASSSSISLTTSTDPIHLAAATHRIFHHPLRIHLSFCFPSIMAANQPDKNDSPKDALVPAEEILKSRDAVSFIVSLPPRAIKSRTQSIVLLHRIPQSPPNHISSPHLNTYPPHHTNTMRPLSYPKC